MTTRGPSGWKKFSNTVAVLTGVGVTGYSVYQAQFTPCYQGRCIKGSYNGTGHPICTEWEKPNNRERKKMT